MGNKSINITKGRLSAGIIMLLLVCSLFPLNLLGATRVGKNDDDVNAKLIKQAEEFHALVVRKGLIFNDDKIEAYVNKVANRIIPYHAKASDDFNVFILRDPIINAVAMPNGNIYVTIGLLARLENEAQLAFVLAHEVMHVIQNHADKTFRKQKSTIIAGHIADLMLFGTSIAYIPAAMTLASFSREQETEADHMGLRLLAGSGYDIHATQRFFEILGEVKAVESIKGSVYSSHPTNLKRMKQTSSLIKSKKVISPSNPEIGDEAYLIIRQTVLFEAIRLKLHQRLYELARDTANIGLRLLPGDPMIHYYLGESYRLTAEDPDGASREYAWIYQDGGSRTHIETFKQQRDEFLRKANVAFKKALEIDPYFHLAYRGLGLVAYERGNDKEVHEFLSRYLNDKSVKDRRYIERLLNSISVR